MKINKIYFFILLIFLTFKLNAESEHYGFRFEIMNQRLVNLYGIGTYTHSPYIDAEMLFYFNPRSLSIFYLIEHLEYSAHYATFSIKFRPFSVIRDFRKLRFQPYIGAGTFPFIIRGFLGHISFGVEFIQTKHFAMDMNLKWIYAIEDGVFQWLPEGWALCLGSRF